MHRRRANRTNLGSLKLPFVPFHSHGASCGFFLVPKDMRLKDTCQAVERLQEGGVPEEQANAIVDLFVDADEQIATQQGLDDLDAKIDEFEQRLSQQMEVQEERLTRKIQETETRLLRWSMGSFAALAALLTLFEYVV
jgi:hypothetical protein